MTVERRFGWGSGSLQGSGKLALHAALDSPAPLSPSLATNSQTGSPTRRRRGSRHRQTQPQSRPPALDTSAKPASQASLRSSTTDEDGPERNAQVTMGGRKPSFLYHYPRPHDPLRSPLRADEFTFGTGAGTNGGGPPGATAGAGGGAGAGSQERRHGGSYIEDKHLVRSSSAASQGSVKVSSMVCRSRCAAALMALPYVMPGRVRTERSRWSRLTTWKAANK